MSRIRVTEAVGMHRRIAGQERGVQLHDHASAASRQSPAAMIEKERRFRRFPFALQQVAMERSFRLGAVGNLPLLSSLPTNAKPALTAVDILQVQTDELAGAESAAIEEFEYGEVTRGVRPLELASRDTIEQPVHLLFGHYLRQPGRRFRRAHQAGGIDLDHAL